ncbi:glycosyltransferase family 4 protein [Methanolobus chelungpuianus]|uniref:Glycosyl transferase family 1 n=1 Tax=Methanolobus chelungpuianus TaxID=502115 RepID=A0AAE3HBW8_9EURY|nr:hypothetical protein [Methanolobus chelungpuianus]
MKILRVAADLYPNVVGGVGLHAHEMSRMQAALGHDVTVYTCADHNGRVSSESGYNSCTFKPLIKLLGNSITPDMLFELWNNRRSFDIIHAHSHLFFSTNLCALVNELGSSPLVVTNHGLNSQTAPKWFQDFYNLTGTRFTYSAADRIICYTDTEKRELVGMGIKANKISVIHNGINTDHFVPADSPCYDKRRLLWIGRYAKGKGVDYLIDAFHILRSRFPGIHLTMVGRGPDKDRIASKIDQLGLDQDVALKDFIPNSEIVSLYQSSSVFVLPSLEEGVPRTILEAMACGIPVVCTRLPQLVDIVDGSGILVSLRDVDSLVQGISEILSDASIARTLGENGRENVVENYSWTDTVKKTIQLYEELI